MHVGGATNPAFLNKNKKSEIRSMQKDNCEIIIVSQKKQQMLHLLLWLFEGVIIAQAYRVCAN